jgi:hypothetical protein
MRFYMYLTAMLCILFYSHVNGAFVQRDEIPNHWQLIKTSVILEGLQHKVPEYGIHIRRSEGPISSEEFAVRILGRLRQEHNIRDVLSNYTATRVNIYCNNGLVQQVEHGSDGITLTFLLPKSSK